MTKERFEERIMNMQLALLACAGRFQEYERSHLASGKLDKALRNAEMKQLCLEAVADNGIHDTTPTPAQPIEDLLAKAEEDLANPRSTPEEQ